MRRRNDFRAGLAVPMMAHSTHGAGDRKDSGSLRRVSARVEEA